MKAKPNFTFYYTDYKQKERFKWGVGKGRLKKLKDEHGLTINHEKKLALGNLFLCQIF